MGDHHRNRNVVDQRPNTIDVCRGVGHNRSLSARSSIGRNGASELRSADLPAQLLLAVHWPPYLNSGADLSWSLVAFMVARQVLFSASYGPSPSSD